MLLHKEEQVVKIFHHSTMGFLRRFFGLIFASVPFYLVAYFFTGVLSSGQMYMLYTLLTSIVAFIAIIDNAFYYLDRLIVTNHRILYIDWKSPLKRVEHEADLSDIQEITTVETGFISFIPLFDFGTFTVTTASAKMVMIFKDAPDPEGIKHFIYHLNIKPSRIVPAKLTPSGNDSERREIREESAVSGR